MPDQIIILGASARAAAFSSLRAGLKAVAIDRFGDSDLRGAAEYFPLDWPPVFQELKSIVDQFPSLPWFYTGPFENQPELIGKIGKDRQILGNDALTLRKCRDPLIIAETLRHSGLPYLEVTRDPSKLPLDGTWLSKPLKSAGGFRIHPLREQRTGPDGDRYYQRKAYGKSGSAVFVANRSTAELIGVTRQWIGRPRSPFAYLGSLGPVRLRPCAWRILRRVGSVLTKSIGLRGLCGFDFVLEDGVPQVVEVNPRYTASVEVLELATGRSLLVDHLRAFGLNPIPDPLPPAPHRFVGKLILYSPFDLKIPADPPWPLNKIGGDLKIADLPPPESLIHRDAPVLTVIERANSVTRVRQRLQHSALTWRRWFRTIKV